MEDRQLRELPYIDDDALAAVGGLRQAAAMVEMMGWVPWVPVCKDWCYCKGLYTRVVLVPGRIGILGYPCLHWCSGAWPHEPRV